MPTTPVPEATPAGDIFRLARGPDPFAPPDWRFAHDDGTFGNRFDDPGAEEGTPESDRFREIHCATQRLAVFAETLARFRVSLSLLSALEAIDDEESVGESLAGALDPKHPARGLVKADWRLRRRVGMTTLDPCLRFADIAAPRSMQHFRHALAASATELGVADIDLSSLTSQQRRFTQRCARIVYELLDSAKQPRFAGVRYPSRHNAEWECRAVFDHRLRHAPDCPGFPANIFAADANLLEVASLFELTVEVTSGHYIRP